MKSISIIFSFLSLNGNIKVRIVIILVEHLQYGSLQLYQMWGGSDANAPLKDEWYEKPVFPPVQ